MIKRTSLLLFICLIIPAAEVWGQNKIHPEIILRDGNGRILSSDYKNFSQIQSCLPCHDTHYINSRNTHYNEIFKTSCTVCHLNPDVEELNYSKINEYIQTPSSMNCASCHGIITDCQDPFVLPPDSMAAGRYDLTLNKGVILSPQDLSRSHLNLEDKKQLNFPWDVHFRRQLECTSCHFTANDPRNCAVNLEEIDHLKRDPRRIKPTQDYLKWPDHQFKVTTCTCCHDPYVIHNNLPYKERHFKKLSCETCHIPKLFGPALQTEDSTVLTSQGYPRMEFRGMEADETLEPHDLNTQYLKGYSPLLLPEKTVDGGEKISPFNLVTRWVWIDGVKQSPVSIELVDKVYFDEKGYRDEIITLLDKNKNQIIENSELVLDSKAKIDYIKKQLKDLGVIEPKIKGTITAYKLFHGVMNIKGALSDCSECHSPDSRLSETIPLSTRSPYGADPKFVQSQPITSFDKIFFDGKNQWTLKKGRKVNGFYVFGFSRIKGYEIFGGLIFLISILGIIGHATARVIFARKIVKVPSQIETLYLYKFYERIWHWIMAIGIILLMVTGFEIHHGNTFLIMGYATAVRVHNIISFIVIINSFLGIFYQLVTGEIQQFFKMNKHLLKETFNQTHFYLWGILKGHRHPIQKTRKRKLNPLQQISYLAVLYLLLPFQIITGLLIWIQGNWPEILGNNMIMDQITPLHNLASWLILTFLIIHLYLITTGHSIFSNLKAMVKGYDDVELGEDSISLEKMEKLTHKEYLKELLSSNKKMGGKYDPK